MSNNTQTRGQILGVRGLERLCLKHLGTSKFHTLRHSFAMSMHKAGASLLDIQRALGHKNLKTTSDYMEAQIGHTNIFAEKLAESFGF